MRDNEILNLMKKLNNLKKATYNPSKTLLDKIQENGGFVNCHAHFDRAFSIDQNSFKLSQKHLHEKWRLVDELKRNSSQEEYEKRIEKAVKVMINQKVKLCATFIDIDEIVKLKAIKAAINVRKKYENQIKLLFASQTLKGVLNSQARNWFEKGLEYIDIIGGLPKTDFPREDKHLDILMDYAKETNKKIHVHVDQENTISEKETELLAKKTLEHNLQNKVIAVHSVSLSAHKKAYRQKIYKLLKEARVSIVTCPLALLATQRSENLSVTHNVITPVEELVENNITVGIGCDNIADIYMPFADGNLWTETRTLLESCRFYNIDELVKITTINGKKILLNSF